jgi:NitT/TauT family transport system permease protein
MAAKEPAVTGSGGVAVQSGRSAVVHLEGEGQMKAVSSGLTQRKRFALSERSNRILGLFSPLLILAIWEVFSRVGILDARFFPPPSLIAVEFWKLLTHDAESTFTGWAIWDSTLIKDIGISLFRVIVGFLAGTIPGLLVGLSMGLFRPVRVILRPIVSATYPIPKLALLPLVLVIFGLGEVSKIVIIALGTFFMVLINTSAGVLNLDKIYLDVAKNFGASRRDFYTKIALPGAMPLIFTGFELGMGMALLLIVAAEMNGALAGIGYLVWASYGVYNLKAMFVAFICISALGYSFAEGLNAIQRKIIPWRQM